MGPTPHRFEAPVISPAALALGLLFLGLAAMVGTEPRSPADHGLVFAALARPLAASMIAAGLLAPLGMRSMLLHRATGDDADVVPAFATGVLATMVLAAAAASAHAGLLRMEPAPFLASVGLTAAASALFVAAAAAEELGLAPALIRAGLGGLLLSSVAAPALLRLVGPNAAAMGFGSGLALAAGLVASPVLGRREATAALAILHLRPPAGGGAAAVTGLLLALGSLGGALAALPGGDARGAAVASLVALPGLLALLLGRDARLRRASRAPALALERASPHAEVEAARRALRDELAGALSTILVLESPLALTTVVLAPQTLAALGLDAAHALPFRLLVLSTALVALLPPPLLLLGRARARREALAIATLLCAATAAARFAPLAGADPALGVFLTTLATAGLAVHLARRATARVPRLTLLLGDESPP